MARWPAGWHPGQVACRLAPWQGGLQAGILARWPAAPLARWPAGWQGGLQAGTLARWPAAPLARWPAGWPGGLQAGSTPCWHLVICQPRILATSAQHLTFLQFCMTEIFMIAQGGGAAVAALCCPAENTQARKYFSLLLWVQKLPARLRYTTLQRAFFPLKLQTI